MFDNNKFKRAVKEWIHENPKASESDLVDFCEEQIPSNHFAANQWLVDQTVSWYRHIMSQREKSAQYHFDDDSMSG